MIHTDWPERTQAHLGPRQTRCSCRPREQRLSRAGLARDVDVIVTVSDGIATPSLDFRVAERIGFRPDIMRKSRGSPCAAVPACRPLRGWRGRSPARSCWSSWSSCTLAFRGDRGVKEDVISAALFGDGAAAAVLRAGDDGVSLLLGASAEHMARLARHHGLDSRPHRLWCCAVAPRPSLSKRGLQNRRSSLPGRLTSRRRSLFFHPAAPSPDAVETALELQTGTLRDERDVLRGHGNMSAPSVLFVRWSGP